MNGGINSLMKLFIYLFIQCPLYVMSPCRRLLTIKCCQKDREKTGKSVRGEGRCVSSDPVDLVEDKKIRIPTKTMSFFWSCFFSNDPTPPLLLLLLRTKNKFMCLIMRATIAVIIFLLPLKEASFY